MSISMEAKFEDSPLPIVRWNAINDTVKKIYYIVDTNILLDFRDLLDDIAGKVCDNYQLTVIIPYSAINELDGLKRSPKINPSKVQNAIKWCNKYIEANVSWIKGQPYNHYNEANSQCTEGADADGRIINCASLYKKTRTEVALISNDINLKNRAILCGLKAYNVKQLYTMLDDSFVVGNLMDDINISSSQEKMANNYVSFEIMSNHSYLNNIRTSIVQSLGEVLKSVMISTYGDLWEKIVLFKPPWTSKTVIKCFVKHWIAIFMDKLPKETLLYLKTVLTELNNIPVMPTLLEVETLAGNVLKLYDNFSTTEYAHHIKRFMLLKSPNNEASLGSQQGGNHRIGHVLNDIGIYANAIFIHNMKTLNHLVLTKLSSDKVVPVINSLTKLQSTLISLGHTFIRYSEDPSLPGYSDIQTQTKHFWTSAQCPDRNVVISYDDYTEYFSTNDSKIFLKHYIKDLEDVINRIQLTLINYEKISKS